ncbi:MAG: hypothetical protein UY04_C0005G0026 [Parcubacteria group bacterium GW2011_GWA2_47_7]|nr:MAG: hypothetical protein UY04_C0005G0026 [Parcubacteria group bacterium GW2011_GWA2_47_7]
MSYPIIHVFGNPDIVMDAIPLRLLPRFSAQFPDVHFIALDPNEEWAIPDPFVLIDTVVGLSEIHVFHSLDEFDTSPTVSVHDFDALFNLRYLAKLGKLKGVVVIGVPPKMNEEEAFTKIVSSMKEVLPH